MFSKINVCKIVRDHIDTLRDDRTHERMKGDFALFFVSPLFVGILIVFVLRYMLDNQGIDILVTSLSVFAALLFNLLLLVYGIILRAKQDNGNNPRKVEFLRQIYANISFSILVAIITVILLLAALLDIKVCYVQQALNLMIYYLVSLFLLTLFMVLKRVHVLLSKEFGSSR